MTAQTDRLESDQLTSHLNHQIVSPIAGLASSIKFLANDLRDRDQSGPPLSDQLAELEPKLRTIVDDIYDLAEEIQDLRADFLKSPTKQYREILDIIEHTFIVKAGKFKESIRQISNDYSGPLTSIGLGDLRTIVRQANQVERMLKNIWASSTHIRLKPLTINVDRIIELGFLNARTNFNEPSISFREAVLLQGNIDAKAPPIADYDKLTEVFQNLFDNTNRYVGITMQQKIKISVSQKNYEFVRNHAPDFIVLRNKIQKYIFITYQDGGGLIDQSDWIRIFDRGVRGNNAPNDDTTGIGYGLYYCRKVLQSHGGGIYYRPSSIDPKKGMFTLFFGEFSSSRELFYYMEGRS